MNLERHVNLCAKDALARTVHGNVPQSMAAPKKPFVQRAWCGEHAQNVSKLVTMPKLLVSKRLAMKAVSALKERLSQTEPVLTLNNALVYTAVNHTLAERRSNKIAILAFARIHSGNVQREIAQQSVQLMVILTTKLLTSSDTNSTAIVHMSWQKISVMMVSVHLELLLRTFLVALVVLLALKLSSLCCMTPLSK
jgi:hypothetical protein